MLCQGLDGNMAKDTGDSMIYSVDYSFLLGAYIPALQAPGMHPTKPPTPANFPEACLL